MRRSDAKRVPLGIVVAAMIATLIGPAPLLAQLVIQRLGEHGVDLDTAAKGLATVAMVSLTMLTVTLVLAAPTWIALRLFRRESGTVYNVCGALAAAIVALILMRPWLGLEPQRLLPIVWCAVGGALSGLCFWLLARQSIDCDPSGHRIEERP